MDDVPHACDVPRIYEGAIHRKIQENKLKPQKTSSWQQRLEKATRDRQAALQQGKKKK